MRLVAIALSYNHCLHLFSNFRVKHSFVNLAPDQELLLFQFLSFFIIRLVLNVNKLPNVELHELYIFELNQVRFLE